MRQSDREKRLQALEAAPRRGVCVAWPEDEPPRYLVDGQPVDRATFDRAAARAAHVITVTYTEEWNDAHLP